MTEPNRLFFDRFSVAHAALGAVAQASRVPALPAIAGSVAFELIENPLKLAVKDIWPDSRPDGWQNSVGDVVSYAAGYYAAEGLAKHPAGRWLATGLVALAAGIWMWSITSPEREGGWATR